MTAVRIVLLQWSLVLELSATFALFFKANDGSATKQRQSPSRMVIGRVAIVGIVCLLSILAFALFSNFFSVILFFPKLAWSTVANVFNFAKFIFPETWMGFYLWCLVAAIVAIVALNFFFFPIMQPILQVVFNKNLLLVSWAVVAYRVTFSSSSSLSDASFDAWNRVVFPLQFCVFHEAWSLVGSHFLGLPTMKGLVKLLKQTLALPFFVVASLVVRLRVKCLVHRLIWYAGCCKTPPPSYAAVTSSLDTFFEISAKTGFKAWPGTAFYDSVCRVWVVWAFVNGAQSCEHHANMSLLIALWAAFVFLEGAGDLMDLFGLLYHFRRAPASPSPHSSEQRYKVLASILKVVTLLLLLAIKRLELFFVAQQRRCAASTTVTFFDFSDVRYAMAHLFYTASAPSPPLSAMSRRCLVFLCLLILYTAAKLGSALLKQLGATTSRDAEQKKRN